MPKQILLKDDLLSSFEIAELWCVVLWRLFSLCSLHLKKLAQKEKEREEEEEEQEEEEEEEEAGMR